VLIESNSKSYQSYGYSRLNVTEVTSGPPKNATLRTSSAHGYSVGDKVFIDNYTGDKAAYNGVQEVYEVIDTLTFSIDVSYQPSGGQAAQPTVEQQEVCFNINGITVFEFNYDGTNIYINKIGDFD